MNYYEEEIKKLRREREAVFEMYRITDGKEGEKRLETIDKELHEYNERIAKIAKQDELRKSGEAIELESIDKDRIKDRWGIDVKYEHEWRELKKNLPLPGLMKIILEFFRKVNYEDHEVELMFWSKGSSDMDIYFFSKEYNCADKSWSDISNEEIVRDSIIIGDANALIMGLDKIELHITRDLTIKLKDYRNEVLSAINSARRYSDSINRYSKLTDESKTKLRSNA